MATITQASSEAAREGGREEGEGDEETSWEGKDNMLNLPTAVPPSRKSRTDEVRVPCSLTFVKPWIKCRKQYFIVCWVSYQLAICIWCLGAPETLDARWCLGSPETLDECKDYRAWLKGFRFREFRSHCFLPLLPELACSIHTTWPKPFLPNPVQLYGMRRVRKSWPSVFRSNSRKGQSFISCLCLWEGAFDVRSGFDNDEGRRGSPKNPIILRSLKRNCVNPSAISSSAHIQAEQLMLHLMNQK